MNIREKIERIEALEAEFNERLEALKAEVQEFPQNGNEYWFIDEEGSVGSTLYNNHYIDDYYIDRCHQTIGNVFKTKERAEFAVEKLKVEAALRKFSRPFKANCENYCIELCSPYKSISTYAYVQFQIQGVIYFESLEKAQQAVSTVGEDRIKKYIFGVED